MRDLFIVVVIVIVLAAAGPWNKVLATPICPATMSGGTQNDSDNTKDCPTVGGGYINYATANFATVSGGVNNEAAGHAATVGGGDYNKASNEFATVGGGQLNNVSGPRAVISGGSTNAASGGNTTVGGGGGNTASGLVATIAGGESNRATDDWGTVAGGKSNQAGDNAGVTTDRVYATVGGGLQNTASGAYGMIAGGRQNTASGGYAAIGGGYLNTASGNYATTGAGYNNTAAGNGATIAGGYQNSAAGYYSTIPGGLRNSAAGHYSLAAGRQAKANHQGSFVWADSTAADFLSTATNQFSVRATGGARFVTNSAGAPTGVQLPAGGGAWSSLSDRNAKANIVAVDSISILERLASIPIQLWNYKAQDASVKHIGPMAQDFHAAFGVGENDTTISTVDADGVALAAIQGLNLKLVEKDQQIAALRVEAATFRTEAAMVQQRLAAVELAQQGGTTAPVAASSGLTLSWGVIVLGVASLIVLLIVSTISLTLLVIRRHTKTA